MLTHQNKGQKSETLTNNRIPNLTYWSYIGTNKTRWNSYLKFHQPYSKLHILITNNKTENLVEDDKHNPQDKMLVLNWHNQNLNITTVEMSIVLHHWLFSKLS